MIRRLAHAGDPLFIRVRSVHPVGKVTDEAERAAIAAACAERGDALLNIGPGGERAPVGSLLPKEVRERAAATRRLRQRTPAARAHQSRVCCHRKHGPAVQNALLADVLTAELDTTPGSRLTLGAIPSALGVTQAAIRKILGEDRRWPASRKPISWRLRRACKARSSAASRAALERTRSAAAGAKGGPADEECTARG